MDTTASVLDRPSDAVRLRLDDPAVAASLVSLLDNADLISILVTGLQKFVERGDTVIESLASAVSDVRGATGGADVQKQIADLKSTLALAQSTLPVLQQLVDSGMFRPEVLGVLTMVAESAVEGAEKAKREKTKVAGIRGLLHLLKDNDLQRGLGMATEIAKALGRRNS